MASFTSPSGSGAIVKRVLITGGGGQIAYSLIPHLISGKVFGPSTRLIIHLLDIPGTENVLRGMYVGVWVCGWMEASERASERVGGWVGR